ncbi:barnase inhibitor [Streptomyces sp. NPDC001652]|uniref:barnase inhibitor n=1 Tax=Streptomyces sp. NPDC001652 TaxID=3154393 RepID=UPI003329DDCD
MTTTYVRDGSQITTLEDFWRVVAERIGDQVIEWREHEASRRHLGHPETARQLDIRLARCHPTNRPSVSAELAEARAGRGPTVFDRPVEIIEGEHPGGLRLR